MIFQGQELLEDGSWHDDDPVDWSKQVTYAGIMQLYRDLIALRRNRHYTTGAPGPARAGVPRQRWGQGPRVPPLRQRRPSRQCHRRHQPWQPKLCRIQHRSAKIGPLAGRFNSGWAGYDPQFGQQDSFDTITRPSGMHGMPYAADIGLGPYSGLILSQDD